MAESSRLATCFTALIVCQTVACGQGQRSAAALEHPDAASLPDGPEADAGPVVDGAMGGDSLGPGDGSPGPKSTPLFDEGTIVDFYVTFSDDAWNKLLTLTGPNDTRWVPC